MRRKIQFCINFQHGTDTKNQDILARVRFLTNTNTNTHTNENINTNTNKKKNTISPQFPTWH